jgi:asparagine synthase (glutamine-hydrolysing)
MIPAPSENDGPDVHERYRIISSGRSSGIGGGRYYGYDTNLLTQVAENFRKCGYPVEHNEVHLRQGLFQDTLHIVEPVAFAHIDGDWYESVTTCLQRIEPHLVRNGVLVIDDYDHWSGCRKAVDEYFEDKRSRYRFIRRSRLQIVRK